MWHGGSRLPERSKRTQSRRSGSGVHQHPARGSHEVEGARDDDLALLRGGEQGTRHRIRDVVVAILAQGVEGGVFDPPLTGGRCDPKAIAMALLDQWTHVSMWYGPGGQTTEEDMARLYADMALRAVGARP